MTTITAPILRAIMPTTIMATLITATPTFMAPTSAA
jgi:hypothetical protein